MIGVIGIIVVVHFLQNIFDIKKKEATYSFRDRVHYVTLVIISAFFFKNLVSYVL